MKFELDKKIVPVYVGFWIFMIVICLFFIITHDIGIRTFECLDGSVVRDQDLCPQCIEDSHCDVDKVCSNANSCVPKSCQDDSDCDKEGNMCVFDICRPG